MLFYDCKIIYKLDEKSFIKKKMKENSKRDWGDEFIQDINEHLNENADEEKISVIIYRIDKEYIYMLVTSIIMGKLSSEKIKTFTEKHLVKEEHFLEIELKTLKEIVPCQAKKLYRFSEMSNCINFRINFDRIFGADYHDVSLDYYSNNTFKVDDYLIPEKILSLEQAKNAAKNLMMHESFIEELERIYDEKNPKEFFGHPVHYKISANNPGTSVEIAKLLCQSLYSNGRVISRCIKRIHDITERCYNENDLDTLFQLSAGSTILIELRGSDDYHKNYASCYEEVIEDLVTLIKQNQLNTLIIFVEITDNPGFATNLITELQEELFIVELKEGVGNRAAALKYLKEVIKENNLISYSDEELSSYLGEQTSFRPSDIHRIYENLYRGSLRNKTYTSYRQAQNLSIPKLNISSKDAYQRLQEMVGLKSVKDLVKQILCAAKMKKIRSDFGLNQESASLHMVFTGNPGSAKTTVARLLAEILSQEGVLSKGTLVECGRSDLVGKYVGWTAPKVAKQFHKAKGGILFIDEAYSLVDNRDGCFGDEAINTIVQEMENNRDNTIVIFAGYPDKMKKFLEKNEGLRSRIAFHLDFPDYNDEELIEILTLMAKRNGYTLSSETKEKCRNIFTQVCRQNDFGNGRFARNLLEQAVLKQSLRLMEGHKGKIRRDEVLELMPEDFDIIQDSLDFQPQKNIGFTYAQ